MESQKFLARWKQVRTALARDHDLAERMLSSLNAEQIWVRYCEEMQAQLGPSHWCLVTRLEQNGQWRVENTGGKAPNYLRGTQLATPPGPAQTLLFGQTPQLLELAHQREKPLCLGPQKALGAKRVLLLPIYIERELGGYFEAVDPQENFYEKLPLIYRMKAMVELSLGLARQAQYITPAPHHDRNTGLENNHQLRIRVQQELLRAARYSHPLSLLLVHLDNYDQSYQNQGKEAAEDLIGQAADILQETLREVDLSYRHGEQTLAALLPETSQQAALVVAKRIQQQLRQKIPPGNGPQSHPLASSIGVASFPEDASESSALLERAEDAVHKVRERKKDGNLLTGDLPLMNL